MKKVLVDTSVIIDFLRRGDKTKSAFYQVFSSGEYQPVIALVTISELWAGKSMENKKTARLVEKIVDGCEILFPDLNIAQKTGEILRQTNYEVAFQDAQIAALARENKLLLLTLNKKDFRKIEGVRFLQARFK